MIYKDNVDNRLFFDKN